MAMIHVKKSGKPSTALVEAQTRLVLKKRVWACFIVILFFGGTAILIDKIAKNFFPSTCAVQAEGASETLFASWSNSSLDGKPTASGVPFDSDSFTGAHPDLTFGTEVFVTNPQNGNTVKVLINDRAKVLIVSERVAKALDLQEASTELKITVIEENE